MAILRILIYVLFLALTILRNQVSSNNLDYYNNDGYPTKRYITSSGQVDWTFRALQDVLSAVDISALTENLGILNVKGGSLIDANLCPSILNNVNIDNNGLPINKTKRQLMNYYQLMKRAKEIVTSSGFHAYRNSGIGNVANGQLLKVIFCLNALNSVSSSASKSGSSGSKKMMSNNVYNYYPYGNIKDSYSYYLYNNHY